VINRLFEVRLPQIWGEGTTACASDSRHFRAWDQNLMTEWHVRYGKPGIMIYWHVERKSACIYSQLKTCPSSGVAAVIEGVLRHFYVVIPRFHAASTPAEPAVVHVHNRWTPSPPGDR